LISNELAVRLAAEVHGRISQYASKPELIYITTDEMKKMSELYPNNVLLTALTNTASVVKKNPTMDRSRVLSTVHSIAERVLLASHAKGKNIVFKGKAYAAPKPVAQPTPKPAPMQDADAELILDIREEFQTQATLQDWTLTEEQAKAYLHQAGSADVMREAMRKLRKYSVKDFEDGLAELSAAIDQVLWMRETTVTQ
jgi:hypothetical protein